MSFSLSGKTTSGKGSSTTNQASQTDPWDETIPYLKTFLGKLGTAGESTGPNDKQLGAIDSLETNGANPWTGDINKLTSDLFASQSGAPAVHQGYDELNKRLSPTADGTNVTGFMDDPNLQKLLQTVGDQTAWRNNSTFAGAGRDMSGINQESTARGVGQAQLPILVDQLNKEKGRSDAAARTLFDANTTAATTSADLDKQAAALRGAGIDTGNAALAARDRQDNQILTLEDMKKKIAQGDMSWLAELLYGGAQLGGQSSGTSYTKTNNQSSSVGGGIGGKL
jgi:hypothetical protein